MHYAAEQTFPVGLSQHKQLAVGQMLMRYSSGRIVEARRSTHVNMPDLLNMQQQDREVVSECSEKHPRVILCFSSACKAVWFISEINTTVERIMSLRGGVIFDRSNSNLSASLSLALLLYFKSRQKKRGRYSLVMRGDRRAA